MPTLGENIKNARKSLHMSQDALAEAIGANRVTISKYENGGYLPSVPALERLADALHTTPAALSGRSNGGSNSWRSLPPHLRALSTSDLPAHLPDMGHDETVIDFGASTVDANGNGIPDFLRAESKPATLGGLNDAVMRLFDEASDLSSEEADQARAFVLGLKANRKPGPVPPPSDQK